MATENAVCFGATVSGAFGAVPESWRDWTADSEAPPDFGLVEPFTVPAVAESPEAVIEDLDAPLAATPAFVDGLRVADPDAGDAPTGSDRRSWPLRARGHEAVPASAPTGVDALIRARSARRPPSN